MERVAEIDRIKELFKDNFIGLEELTPFFRKLGFSDSELNQINIPVCNIAIDELPKYVKDYILILGIRAIGDINLTIKFIRSKLGHDPDISEPCFYNQDWYLKETFIDSHLESKWYLIKKNVYENTRAIQPADIIKDEIIFPSAVLCTYTFFANYFCYNNILWEYDFIWCSDMDHNGDRIYVGKYRDIDKINKNGFSIHRHLSLRPCYAAIDFF